MLSFMLTQVIIAYCFIGLFAGTLSGLLGIGGGSIIVPALAFAFSHQHIDENIAVHMAAATSLAIMVITTQMSVRNHRKKIEINWDIFKRLLPGTLTGVIIGHILSMYLSGHSLKICFAIFLFVVAIRMLGFEVRENLHAELPSKTIMHVAGLFIGSKSGLLGIGGGGITIPFLTYYQISMRQAIAISALISFTVASFGAFLNIIHHTHVEIAWATGYIYWPAVILTAIPSTFGSKFGVFLSHKLPIKILRKVFAILLLCTAVDLII